MNEVKTCRNIKFLPLLKLQYKNVLFTKRVNKYILQTEAVAGDN